MNDKLLTPEQAAEILTVAPKTIREWLKSGKLSGVKVGRLWRIKESDLQCLLLDAENNGEAIFEPNQLLIKSNGNLWFTQKVDNYHKSNQAYIKSAEITTKGTDVMVLFREENGEDFSKVLFTGNKIKK